MESKHVFTYSDEIDDGLLIEAVWNRNGIPMDSAFFPLLLLIEAVWNRNFSMRPVAKALGHQLLIEPVWNRNQTSLFVCV